MIAWSIEAGRQSQYIDRVIVSTEDPEIAEVARRYGAEVPTMRPAELASDTAKSIDAVNHMLTFMKSCEAKTYDFVVLLQATSPFRTGEDIDCAIEYLFSLNGRSLISFCKAPANPYWMVTKNADGTYKAALPRNENHFQRQKLPEFYEYNGAVYIAEWSHVLCQSSFENKDTLFFEMPAAKSIDIDTPDDWDYAEYLFKKMSSKVNSPT